MLFAQLVTLLADAQAPPPDGGGGGPPAWGALMWILPIVVLAYFLLIRGPQKQESQRKEMLNKMKKGDKVITSAGIIGSIVSVHETEDECVIETGNDTRLKILKSTIYRNVTQEEAAKKVTK